MKIWILIGGWDYEGYDANQMRVSSIKPTDKEVSLFEKDYDYVEVFEEEIKKQRNAS